jgi:hypothetical protein
MIQSRIQLFKRTSAPSYLEWLRAIESSVPSNLEWLRTYRACLQAIYSTPSQARYFERGSALFRLGSELHRNFWDWQTSMPYHSATKTLQFAWYKNEINYAQPKPVNSIYLPGTITFSHLAVKKWSLAWAVASALHAISTPYSTSVSVPLYAITARSDRHAI